jgi:putative transposase
VAQYDGITDHLGHKEKHGMRKSMATRAAFLADPTPPIVCHSTPKHASWMNHIEMWCSLVVRQ